MSFVLLICRWSLDSHCLFISEPAASNQQPATSNQQPAASNQQPATSNQQPATSNQQPATFFTFVFY
jgi:hypothetical protein